MEPTHRHKYMTKPEDIQIFALRMCCKNWDAGYQELLDLTTMPTLENRRLYLKLCSLYKIIYGHFYFPPNGFTAQPSRTHLVSPLLNQPHARTNYYQSSFVPSIYHLSMEQPPSHRTYSTHYSIIQSTHRTLFCNCFNCFNTVHTGISCTYSYYVSVALLLLLRKFS